MVVLYNGEMQEYDITQNHNWEQTLEYNEYRQVYLGQQFGDFEIIKVDYDWGTRRQANVAKCVKCGAEKKIKDLAAFKRGKGEGQLCGCGYKKEKKEYIPMNIIYKKHIGEIHNGFLLVDYVEKRGFRIECIECGKRLLVTGKSVFDGTVECNHKIISDYSDPKYVGMKVGSLTAIEYLGDSKYRFRCDCGTEVIKDPCSVFRRKEITTCGRLDCNYHKERLTLGDDSRRRGLSFEFECANALEEYGYATEMTPSSGDYGVDFFATIDGKKVAFQCKKLKKQSSVRSVQEVFSGGNFYGCDRYIVVSPSGFTERAKIMAEKLGVGLVKNIV